jgi:hypothetical protein
MESKGQAIQKKNTLGNGGYAFLICKGPNGKLMASFVECRVLSVSLLVFASTGEPERRPSWKRDSSFISALKFGRTR